MTNLKLSARIESENPRHARITVLQNGANAGVLCVDKEHAEQIVGLINAAVDWLAALKQIAKGEGAFSRDPLQHAQNCITEMVETAQAAIAKAGG